MVTTIERKKARLLPDDMLAAILTQTGLDRFKSHDFLLQQIFSSLVNEHPDLLRRYFVYSDAGPEPYSPALGEAISRLQLSGLIGRENPDYEVIIVKQSARDYFDRVLRRALSDAELQEVEVVAREFKDRIRDSSDLSENSAAGARQ